MAALSLKLGKLDAICAKLKCSLSSSKVNNNNNGICDDVGTGDSNGSVTTGNRNGVATGNRNGVATGNSIDEQSVPVCALDSNAKKRAITKSASFEVDENKCGAGACGSPESNNNNKKLADYNKSFETTLTSTPATMMVGSGRKKSRKSSTPRSIPLNKSFGSLQFCDEKDDLSEYEINNQSRDLSSSLASSDREMDEVDEYYMDENGASLASSRVTSPIDFDRSSNYEIDEVPDGENGNVEKSSEIKSGSPLDLSIGRNEDDSRESLSADFSDRDAMPSSSLRNAFDSDQSVQSAAAADQSVRSASVAEDRSQTVATGNSPDTTEVRVLQDYANNTMNELLSIYGFGGPLEPLSQQIPLKNFSKYQRAAHSLAQTLGGCRKGSEAGVSIRSPLAPNGLSPRSTKGLYSSLSATAKLAHLNGGKFSFF